MGNQIYDEKFPLSTSVVLTSTAGTAWNPLLYSAVAGSFRLDTFLAKTDSVVDLTITIGWWPWSTYSNTAIPIATIILPASSGNGVVALMDVFASAFPVGFPGFVVVADHALLVKVETAIAANKSLYLWLQGGEL